MTFHDDDRGDDGLAPRATSLEMKDQHIVTSPRLETGRLILRTITPADRASIVAILSDTVAMAHMHYRFWDIKQCHRWVDTALEIAGGSDSDGLCWVIQRRDTGETIGWFGIGNPPEPSTAFDISFEYALARAHWGHGFMPEALQTVFAYEFDILNVPQLQANCHPTNTASARVMEKAGMRFTHTDRAIGIGGYLQEQHHYRITRHEWDSRKPTCP